MSHNPVEGSSKVQGMFIVYNCVALLEMNDVETDFSFQSLCALLLFCA